MKYSLTENLEQAMFPQWEKSLHVQKSRRWGLQGVGSLACQEAQEGEKGRLNLTRCSLLMVGSSGSCIPLRALCCAQRPVLPRERMQFRRR